MLPSSFDCASSSSRRCSASRAARRAASSSAVSSGGCGETVSCGSFALAPPHAGAIIATPAKIAARVSRADRRADVAGAARAASAVPQNGQSDSDDRVWREQRVQGVRASMSASGARRAAKCFGREWRSSRNTVFVASARRQTPLRPERPAASTNISSRRTSLDGDVRRAIAVNTVRAKKKTATRK